jgi:hypothetical protein
MYFSVPASAEARFSDDAAYEDNATATLFQEKGASCPVLGCSTVRPTACGLSLPIA